MLPRPASSRKARPQVASLISTAQRSLGITAFNGPLSASSPSASSGKQVSSEASIFDSLPKLSAGLPSPTTTAFVVSCLLWYMSSALSSNTSKALLSSPKNVVPRPPPPFPYPVTLTMFQFCMVHLLSAAIASPTIMRHVPGMRKPVTRIARNIGWSKLADMAKLSIFNVVGHVLSTVAISRVPVSTVHTIKALTPLFTVLSFHFFFNIHYSYMTYLSLLPLTLGVMMACTSLSFSANDLMGLSTALASTLIFVAQSIYSKNLIGRGAEINSSSDKESKLDKVNILYYSSASSVLIMIPMALYYDGSALLSAATSNTASLTATATTKGLSASLHYIFAMIIANGVAQFFQAFLAFTVLTLVSPVTYSIASLFKRVFVICFAIVWFGQSVGKLQWMGIVLTFFGLYLYNDSKATKSINMGEEKLREEERNKSMSLPSFNPATLTSSASVLKPAFDFYNSGQRSAQSANLPDLDTRTNGYAGGYRDMSQVDVITSPSTALRHTPRRIPQNEVVALGSQHSPYFKDPRSALPSPPPSRSSSSDDEANTLRSPSQRRQMSLKEN